MVWERFLLVNEKYNPITQEWQNLALSTRFNLQWVAAKGGRRQFGI
jgi:hypothetical protein